MTPNDEKHEMSLLRSSGDSIKESTRMHGFVSYRPFGKARSFRNDRNVLALSRYVATELGSSSVAT
ncbi:hypothetical protein DY000_02016242 [Brassica cretica]|uniref:Uncharacterized protein n=1 Tax=Brassica cretica TaxID=69181 RepID=A0ABQ7CTV5_BRACR|nr:hypothetical protein DY000_02016242 [Brassica cretica]